MAIHDGDDLKKVRLKIPVSLDDISKLEPGQIVFLDGVVYTGREGVYQRVMSDGYPIPVSNLAEVSNVNFHCSPAAAENPDGGFKVGGVTATASFRFSKWMKRWLELSGSRIIIGKGGMPRDDYKQILAPAGAVYLTTVGYGTGALLGRGITGVRNVYWLDELGIAQAMWLFEVQNFGPFIVDSDLQGNSLFAEHGDIINSGLAKVYGNLKPPALRRFGETDDLQEEVV